jgi:hypothetical protein
VQPKTAHVPKQRGCNGHSVQEVDAAVDAYNHAASTHGFTPCRTLTDARRKRLQKRLDDIGGVDEFKRALSALPSNAFLMGRVPPKGGRAPFRLDIDTLLQTEGNLGDVLGKLLDAAGDAPKRALTFEEEAQELAASNDGRDFIRQHGVEEGTRIIREVVGDNRRSRGLD